MPPIIPVILSGGVGSRLWPLSRSLFPKQLLSLTSGQTLIQDTVQRASGTLFDRPVVVCNAEHRFLVAEQIRHIGAVARDIILEPVGRNTAPAIAVAALRLVADIPDAVLLVMPADHVVKDHDAFRTAVITALPAAQNDRLVTFGITPKAPETGFGYVQRGNALSEAPGVFHVTRFVEKPDLNTAQHYLDQGDYYWNSGMFLFRARTFLEELERLQPSIVAACREAVVRGKRDLDFFRLAEAPFAANPSISIDYAVMEHTKQAAMLPANMDWSDIGSWTALWETASKDPSGNMVAGDVLSINSTDCYLRSDGPLVAAIGLQNMIVVATSDAVLIAEKNSAQDVKKIVDQLQRSGRDLHLNHPKVYRPWGSYEVIDTGSGFQAKRITVNPGSKLSLQLHHRRAEHWVVVSGQARVICGENDFLLNANESTFIPLGVKHRLENVGSIPLHLIEVQSGDYLGEDDIVRFDDSYGR